MEPICSDKFPRDVETNVLYDDEVGQAVSTESLKKWLRNLKSKVERKE